MSEFNVTVEGGKTVRLKTAGKYCDRDIVVTAEGGGGDDLFLPLMERTVTEFHSESVSVISQYIFYGYTALTTIDFPNATTIGGYAFYNDTGITSFNTPNVRSIGTYAFYNVSTLSSIYFPEVTSIGTYALRQCRKITRGYFPKLTSVGTYALTRCNLLAVVDLGLVSSVPANLFSEDSKLTTIILRKTDGIATLAATSAFTSTPFASSGSGGTAYVPSALITAYQTATNWSSLNCTFVALEGSAYESENWGKV